VQVYGTGLYIRMARAMDIEKMQGADIAGFTGFMTRWISLLPDYYGVLSC